ncbi:MAG: AsmA-like C-terminal region-containing protein [Tannerellaceae bacterium]|nr:AsmA-like C-terminal region-containing protein [Tannerellaceae bacterium]
MKSKKKICIIIISILVTVIFVIPAVGFCILKWGILPPEKLTPLVLREANKYIIGELECEQIELTFRETYPRLGVRMTNGNLISHALRDSTDSLAVYPQGVDSLLSFKRAVVSVNPFDYFRQEKITISGIFIEELALYWYINEEGKANWEIYRSEEDTETDENESVSALPPIDLQRLRMKGGHFIYDDRQSGVYTEVEGFSLRLKGSLADQSRSVDIETESSSVLFISSDQQGDVYAEVSDFFLRLRGALRDQNNLIDIETRSSSILFDSPSYTLKNKLALALKSKIQLTDEFHTVVLEGAELLVNELPFRADGRVSRMPETNQLDIDIEASLKADDMNELLDFVPEEYFQDRKKMMATGSVQLDGSIRGIMTDSLMPTIDLCCKIENGSYFMKGVDQGIESLELDMDLHFNGQHPDSSFVALEKLILKGLNTSLFMKGKVTDMFRSPFIDATLKGQVDFTRLAKEFLNPDTLLLQGLMDADIYMAFRVDDILDGKYNHVKALGHLNIDKLRAFSRPVGLGVSLAGVRFMVDSAKQTSSYLSHADLLSAYLKVDTLNVRYKRQINTHISGLDMQAKTSPVIDTTAVIPLTTHITFESLRTRMPDSVWVTAKNGSLRGGIKPSDSNKQLPVLGASIKVDTLKYFDVPIRSGLTMANNMFNIEALPYRDAMRQRQQQRQRALRNDTTQVNQVRSTRGNTTPQQSRTNRDSTQSSGGFLRNWEVRGSVSFDQTRMFSRLFPLPMRIEKSKVKFDTNGLTFTDAHLYAGKSDFVLTGEVKNMRRAMLRGGKLEGNFSLGSDYIDCNQLLQAVNRGMQYAEEKLAFGENDIEEETLMDSEENELQTASVELTDTTETLFVVPKFLDMTFHTNIRKMDFNDLNLENLEGEVVVRNQSVNLKKLNLSSNIGHGNLTMVYTAKDRTEANAGFDLELDNIVVDRLIGMFPAIDTLLPMLRSFEGVLDCQMTASCDLDSTMSVVLPSLQSACYLSGVDMVLLDGETFTEISKTLMFKNKQRNQIDSISVDLTIRDNKIEVFPFLLEMDRYRVAVGGTHNLDMTFNYHLSVLKSPVPFKLGIDITGNLDKFKYKITKCKYKDLFKPAREAELDATRTNLRTEIREAIRKQMQANAPELARNLDYNPTRRRPVAIDIEE